ncbi:MAG TPA: glycosyltransferase family 39 protein [Tepidisphaeraceae bacterium]|jgi:hypothetical protein
MRERDPEPSGVAAPAGVVARRKWEVWLVAGATLAVLLVFLGRAFNVDEPLFIWAGEWIRLHPLDFYGFGVNWYGAGMRMSEVMKNPPLASYFIALAGKVVGESEVELHGAFVIWGVGVIVGTYELARMITARAMLAAGLALFSPVVLISATTVMCDVMMLCLWVWAVVLWMKGLKAENFWMLLAAAVLAGVSALTKYFGVSLIPLMVVMALVQQRRMGPWAAALVVPVAMLVAYQVWTQHLYGRGLLLDAAGYAANAKSSGGKGRFAQLVAGLSFAGGACVGMVPMLAASMRRRMWAIWGAASLLLVGGVIAFDPIKGHELRGENGFDVAYAAQLAALITVGAIVMIAAGAEMRDWKGTGIWLGLWVLGTFVFAAFLNWSVNARSILPMAPAVALIACRRLDRRGTLKAWELWSLAPAAALALACAWSDTAWANVSRDSSAAMMQRAKNYGTSVYVNGHWGFQYYMEKAGAVAVDARHFRPRRGDLVAYSVNNTNVLRLELGEDERERLMELRPVPLGFLTVMHQDAHAGFYSDVFGPLPYAFGAAPPEDFFLEMLTSRRLPEQRR